MTRTSRAFQRLRRLARRVADLFPVTPLGLFVGGASGTALRVFAYGKLDLVFLVLGWGAVGLTALGIVTVVAGAIWLKVRTRPAPRTEPLALETERPTPTGFRVSSLVWLPLVQVRWEWEHPEGVRVEPARRFGRHEETIVLRERGELRGVRRRIVVEDAFGLARVAIRKDDPLVLDVVPHAGGLRRMPVLTSLAGGDEQPHPMGLEDGDRVELRRYAPGDPARFIHWKVFSRTRRLMVRMPERALTRARRTVAYLVAGPDDEASAAAARVAIETDALGGEWIFGADGATHDARSPEEAIDLVVRSIAAREKGAAGLEPFLVRAERAGPASAVVFAPPRPGRWLDAVVAIAKKRRGRMRIVIGVDGLAKRPERKLWQRLIAFDPASEGTSADALDEVLRILGTTRCEVVVLDRTSGRRLGEGHRAAARALAGAAA